MAARSKRPSIGLNLDFESEPIPRSLLRATYYDAVHRAGGTPFLLAPLEEPEIVDEMLERVDGLVLTGGDDVDPAHFGEERHPTCKLLDRRRCAFDLLLARSALERRIPILAICCGMQALNVVLGGSLIQDIASLVGTVVVHSPPVKNDPIVHEVRVEPASRLREIVGADRVVANSAHHQCCGRMGARLAVAARAEDGVVEAWEDPAHPFLIGVQWHPERLADRAEHLALFRALVDAAARARMR